MKRSVILIVLDGWGIGREDATNPIYVAKLPTIKWLGEHFPVTSLQASGISIGLPWGEAGNSEVGHLTMGAGRVVYQYYPRISLAVRDKSFYENKALKDAFAHAKQRGTTVNFVGLLTKANTHASLEHIEALITMAEKEGCDNYKLHLFADGKDSPPKSLNELLAHIPMDHVSTLTGRYYAMDRGKNWQLTQKAYECLTGGAAVTTDKDKLQTVIDGTYKKGLTEEFIPPTRLGGPERSIQNGEAVIFFNFREDSMRQIAESFLLPDFSAFPRTKLDDVYEATMTEYEKAFTAPVAFPPDHILNPLGRIVSDAGGNQLRLAETYKYAHVTYFFNGYRDEPFPNEYRALIPSLTTPHPEEHPELVAAAITDRLIQAIETRSFDFVLTNYANPDTIAHTGNYDAGIAAARVIDTELSKIVKSVLSPETVLLITSDHGNLEEMLSPQTGMPETQHDPSPVPLYLIGSEFKGRKFVNWRDYPSETLGILSDVAPTILDLLGIPQPPEMNGKDLLHSLVI